MWHNTPMTGHFAHPRNQRTDTLGLGVPKLPNDYMGPTRWKRLNTETEYKSNILRSAAMIMGSH